MIAYVYYVFVKLMYVLSIPIDIIPIFATCRVDCCSGVAIDDISLHCMQR